jgi:hypothetical protein
MIYWGGNDDIAKKIIYCITRVYKEKKTLDILDIFRDI